MGTLALEWPAGFRGDPHVAAPLYPPSGPASRRWGRGARIAAPPDSSSSLPSAPPRARLCLAPRTSGFRLPPSGWSHAPGHVTDTPVILPLPLRLPSPVLPSTSPGWWNLLTFRRPSPPPSPRPPDRAGEALTRRPSSAVAPTPRTAAPPAASGCVAGPPGSRREAARRARRAGPCPSAAAPAVPQRPRCAQVPRRSGPRARVPASLPLGPWPG